MFFPNVSCSVNSNPTVTHNHVHPHQDHRDDFHDPNFLRPHTHVAYHHVESACAADVKALCTPLEAPKTLGDPFWDWVFLSETAAPPPEIEDISSVIDSMLDSFYQLPVTFVYATYSSQGDYTVQDINFVVDSTAARLAENSNEEDIPVLAEKLQGYGNEMLDRYPDESHGIHHSMARRLTEVDAMDMKHRVKMPFGCRKNACLLDALNQNKVSHPCKSAVKELEFISRREIELETGHAILMNMINVYLILLFIALLMLVHKSRSHKDRRRMRNRILQTIYSNPELKKQVEEELGESVGVIPPMPYFALKLMSAGGRDLKRSLRRSKRVHLMFFALLTVLILVAPVFAFPICIMITFVRGLHLCFHLCCMSDNDITRECQCCCCGATTTNVLYGTLTEEQACCDCCNGTGICAPSCKSCCGPDACCNDNCCESKVDLPKEDGRCCCCGASPSMVMAGTLTPEQECCGCCAGTGCCTSCCTSCCNSCCGDKSCCGSSTSKGLGQKHLLKPTECVYEGVPVQIV